MVKNISIYIKTIQNTEHLQAGYVTPLLVASSRRKNKDPNYTCTVKNGEYIL